MHQHQYKASSNFWKLGAWLTFITNSLLLPKKKQKKKLRSPPWCCAIEQDKQPNASQVFHRYYDSDRDHYSFSSKKLAACHLETAAWYQKITIRKRIQSFQHLQSSNMNHTKDETELVKNHTSKYTLRSASYFKLHQWTEFPHFYCSPSRGKTILIPQPPLQHIPYRILHNTLMNQLFVYLTTTHTKIQHIPPSKFTLRFLLLTNDSKYHDSAQDLKCASRTWAPLTTKS